MLTPQEISGKEFGKAVFGGYDVSAVDEFMESITEDYSSLYKENAILKSKIKVLVEKVEEYRSTEDAMRMALLTAQKMGDDMVKESEDKSKTILAEAEEAAARRTEELQAEIEKEEARLKVAKDATEAYARQASALTEKLSSFLKTVPQLAMENRDKTAPAVSAADTREEEIMDTVHDINNAMTKITGEEGVIAADAEEEAPVEDVPQVEAPAAPAEVEPKAAEPVKPKYDDEGEFTVRPKFDFENLRFGSNFSDND